MVACSLFLSMCLFVFVNCLILCVDEVTVGSNDSRLSQSVRALDFNFKRAVGGLILTAGKNSYMSSDSFDI